MHSNKIKNNVKIIRDDSFRTIIILLPGVFLLLNYYVLSVIFFSVFLILYKYTSIFDKCKEYDKCKKNIFMMHILSIFFYITINVFPSTRVMILFLWFGVYIFITNKISKYHGL